MLPIGGSALTPDHVYGCIDFGEDIDRDKPKTTVPTMLGFALQNRFLLHSASRESDVPYPIGQGVQIHHVAVRRCATCQPLYAFRSNPPTPALEQSATTERNGSLRRMPRRSASGTLQAQSARRLIARRLCTPYRSRKEKCHLLSSVPASSDVDSALRRQISRCARSASTTRNAIPLLLGPDARPSSLRRYTADAATDWGSVIDGSKTVCRALTLQTV
jgi:hypothetical protein